MSLASRTREAARRLQVSLTTGRPRNPTCGQRRAGFPRLSDDEWVVLRAWQWAEVERLTNTPEARTERAAMEARFAAGEPISDPPIEVVEVLDTL